MEKTFTPNRPSDFAFRKAEEFLKPSALHRSLPDSSGPYLSPKNWCFKLGDIFRACFTFNPDSSRLVTVRNY